MRTLADWDLRAAGIIAQLHAARCQFGRSLECWDNPAQMREHITATNVALFHLEMELSELVAAMPAPQALEPAPVTGLTPAEFEHFR